METKEKRKKTRTTIKKVQNKSKILSNSIHRMEIKEKRKKISSKQIKDTEKRLGGG